MKALVTGGGGFLGRYIVEQLIDQGHEVTSLSRGTYPELNKIGVATIQADIQDAEAVSNACQGVDTVFHVAAQPGVWGKWKDFYEPNVIGTESVIAACRAQDVRKLVFTSSPSVIFNNKNQEGVDESIPYPKKYETAYAHTKAIAERMVIAANDREGLLTVSLRPHLIFGPRDNHLVPTVIERARAGQVIMVGKRKNMVDISYVEDVARAHLLAAKALSAKSPAAGSVYFISQDEPVNLWGFINTLLVNLGIPPVRRFIPLRLARLAGLEMEVMHRILRRKGEPRMTRFLASELGLSHYYDISRAKKDLGYKPKIKMARALQNTIRHLDPKRELPVAQNTDEQSVQE